MSREETVKALTQFSDYLIDFSRIAERLISSKDWMPNYSQNEKLQRLFIIVSTMVAGLLGNRFLNQAEQPF